MAQPIRSRRRPYDFQESDIHDEQDLFLSNADVVNFVPDVDKDESEDGDDYDSEDDVQSASSESEGDDGEAWYSEDSDAKEEAELKRRREIESENLIVEQWGSKRKNYYGADDGEGDASDEDAEKEEEEEVRRLRKEQIQKYREDDFADDDMLETILKKLKKPSSTKPRKKSKDESALQQFNESFNSATIPGILNDDRNIEKVTKDLSSLTKKDKLEIVMADSQELPGMLEDFKTKVQELLTDIQPLQKDIREFDLGDEKCAQYLDSKFHLIITYCTYLSFYLTLKAQGRFTKTHPVIKNIIRVKGLLSQLESVDQQFTTKLREMVQNKREIQKSKKVQKRKASKLLQSPSSTTTQKDNISAGKLKKSRKKKSKKRSPKLELARPQVEDDTELLELTAVRPVSKRKRGTRETKLEDLSDFGDDIEPEITLKKSKKSKKSTKMSKSKKQTPVPESSEMNDSDFGLDESEVGDLLKFYESHQDAAKQKKEQKTQKAAKGIMYSAPTDIVGKDERRGIGSRIDRNVGLKRYRPRDNKNPRARLREKARKKTRNRKGAHALYKPLVGAYHGEMTGINKNVTKSVSLKD